MSFWADRRVLLTGGGGFLGSHLRERLEQEKPAELLAPRAAELDLRDGSAIERFLEEHRPNLIIHAAAVVGGIGANRLYPGRFFYENAIMGIQLIEQARRFSVDKFVCLGTVCAYPKFTPVPFQESELWNGYPEETNAPYGLAKKMLLVQLQAYRQEYGFNGVFLLPANLYGPGDNFDPRSSHVIPALIRKCADAVDSGADRIEVWGDGTPTREFLYVDDAVEGILLAAERYNSSEPVNLGSGVEISIAELVRRIAAEVGFTGRIDFDPTKPNGQMRRQLDVRRAEERFGFRAKVPFEEGLRKTVDWYLQTRAQARSS